MSELEEITLTPLSDDQYDIPVYFEDLNLRVRWDAIAIFDCIQVFAAREDKEGYTIYSYLKNWLKSEGIKSITYNDSVITSENPRWVDFTSSEDWDKYVHDGALRGISLASQNVITESLKKKSTT